MSQAPKEFPKVYYEHLKFLEENVGDDRDTLMFLLTTSAKELGRNEEHIEYLQTLKNTDIKGIKHLCIRYELQVQQKREDEK